MFQGGRGEGRNRTMSSSAASLNTMIYKGILTLVLQRLKRLLELHTTYRLQPAARTARTRLLKNSLKVLLNAFFTETTNAADETQAHAMPSKIN